MREAEKLYLKDIEEHENENLSLTRDRLFTLLLKIEDCVMRTTNRRQELFFAVTEGKQRHCFMTSTRENRQPWTAYPDF